MLRSRLAAVLLLFTTLLTSSGVFASDIVVEVVARGEVTESWDDTNALGYGASGNAVGAVVTLTYRYFLASVPPDVYGGARFPAEADYQTSGEEAPNWIESSIRFDSRRAFSSMGYVGDGGGTDQVKIMDRAGGAAFDYYGVYDSIADETPFGIIYRSYSNGARFHEYVTKVVNGLAPDQRIRWTPDEDGSEVGTANFAMHDDSTLVDVGAVISLKSFQVFVKKEGGKR